MSFQVEKGDGMTLGELGISPQQIWTAFCILGERSRLMRSSRSTHSPKCWTPATRWWVRGRTRSPRSGLVRPPGHLAWNTAVAAAPRCLPSSKSNGPTRIEQALRTLPAARSSARWKSRLCLRRSVRRNRCPEGSIHMGLPKRGSETQGIP